MGRGSFGEVYRAFDPTLQRHVALKLLLPVGLHPDVEANSLLREARAMARVRHPNVVPIYGVGTHEGRSGFWSDFVKGKTLSEVRATQGPLDPREVALIGIDVCKAVGAVHAAGFVHRDIKAGNIMREEGGRILLMDFGLTYEAGGNQQPSGTPNYMAPELLLGAPATVASDVYAIGVLLFNLLTAKYPVEGDNFDALRAAHASGARRTLIDVRPDLPAALAHVIETALAAPQKRFTSAGLMIAALSDAIGMRPGSLAAALDVAPVRTRAERSFRTWMLAPLVAAAVALALFFPQVRAVFTPTSGSHPRLASTEEEYRRAHDLLAHYYRPKALETAVPLLEQIVARDPQFAPAFADLARANYLQFSQQRDTKFIEPARQSALRAVALAPDSPSAHATLGALYAITDQHDLASHELEEALRLDRFNAVAYGAQAELYKRQGRADSVESMLQKAVSLSPNDWGLAQQLGEYYLDHGKWAEAEAQYRRAVELVPDNPRAYNNLGLVYRGMDRLDDAAAAFQQAIDLEPTALRFRNLGMVLAESGKYPEASHALERSIEMQPSQYRAWGLLASVYLNQHADETKTRATYLKAIELSADLRKETPKDEDLLAAVGSYYAALGMEREALPVLAQAAALAADLPEVLYQVAVGYEMLHHREEALQWLAKARTGGYSPQAIARDPQLTALRSDPRYGVTVAAVR